jgi:UDPglucose 6-dehydrogenase
VIGLGKLGSPMAALFAAKGHDVIALDVNPSVVSLLQSGRAPVDEPKLQETINAGRSRLTATSDFALAAQTEAAFIVVPTPSDAGGGFSNEYVLAAVDKLGSALASYSEYHLVAITSTVMPGSMDGPIRETLERASGRTIGADIGLCYNPEFIALGSVIDNMLEPDFLLIGESDARAGAFVATVYDSVCSNNPPVRRMSFINAELTKIAINTYVTTKISYANMLADLCDRLPGADADVVATAVGSDSRIGRKYLRGAIGYGGPCFPRDNVAFSTLAAQLGANADIARATDAINRYQIERLNAAVIKRVSPGARVAVLGMSYKPDTPIIEESQGIQLAQRLHNEGYAVTIHDPMAGVAAARALGAGVTHERSATEAVRNADIAVITTPWPEYALLDRGAAARRIPVIDCWRILSKKSQATFEIIWLGYGEQVAATAKAVIRAERFDVSSDRRARN